MTLTGTGSESYREDLLARLQSFGLAQKIGKERLYPALHTAVEAYQDWTRRHDPKPGPEGTAGG